MLSDGKAEALSNLAHAHASVGNLEQARSLLSELRAADGGVEPSHIAAVHASLGEMDEAIDWLERAYEQRSPELLSLKVDTRFDVMRTDSRFVDLIERVGLPH